MHSRSTAATSLILLATFASCASTNEPMGLLQTGAEVQVYPAGVMPGLHLRKTVSDHDVVFARLAANRTNRRDFGEHDRESGGGFGGGLGWRRMISGANNGAPDGFHYGARVDLWNLEIDWRDPGPRTGSTDILVLQPSAEFGYGWTHPTLGRFETTLGLGVEINVDTDGEDVGEGPILLFGLTWLP